jgi:hypothetical protein
MILAAQDYTVAYIAAAVAVATILVFVVICALKGKAGLALLGFFLAGIFAIVGAIRIAKPGSWWARRNYEPGGPKEQLALQRFAEGVDQQRRDEYWDKRTEWGQ